MLVHVARNSSCLPDGNNKISVAWFEICFILQPTSEILTIGLYFGCSFKYTTNQQPDVRESLQRNISSKALTNVLWTVNHLQAQQPSDRPLFRAGSWTWPLEVSISWMPTMMGRWLSSWNGKISPCYEMMGFRWDFWMSLFSCDSQWDLWEILASNIRSSTTQGYTLWLFVT